MCISARCLIIFVILNFKILITCAFVFRPGGIPAKNAKGEHVLLFLGIIDILQSFRLKKKLEHAWKSVLHDGVKIIHLV